MKCGYAGFLAALALLGIGTGCSESNNVLLGEVRETLGTHRVVVTDCYRTSVPPPVRDGADYIFTPCRDAGLVIRDEVLFVNGQSYGHLNPGDGVMVDHGKVSVTRK